MEEEEQRQTNRIPKCEFEKECEDFAVGHSREMRCLACLLFVRTGRLAMKWMRLGEGRQGSICVESERGC